MIHDAIGDHFKAQEQQFRLKLDRNKTTIIRLDGMRFHSFTKPFLYPFDPFLRFCLDQSLIELIEKELKSYVSLVYFQSDEASIVLPPITKEEDRLPFDGRVEKLNAILCQWNVFFWSKLLFSQAKVRELPSIKTSFNVVESLLKDASEDYQFLQMDKYFEKLNSFLGKTFPGFDCRFIQVSSFKEIDEYLGWRRVDAIRNYKSMIGNSFFSPKSLKGLTAKEIIEKVEQESHFKYAEFPVFMKRGTIYRTNKFKSWYNDEFLLGDPLTQTFQQDVLSGIKNRSNWS